MPIWQPQSLLSRTSQEMKSKIDVLQWCVWLISTVKDAFKKWEEHESFSPHLTLQVELHLEDLERSRSQEPRDGMPRPDNRQMVELGYGQWSRGWAVHLGWWDHCTLISLDINHSCTCMTYQTYHSTFAFAYRYSAKRSRCTKQFKYCYLCSI